MTCPRCGVDLKRETLSGMAVDRCPSCWGTWLDKGEFGALVASREFRFSETEVDAVLKGLTHEANTPQPKPDPILPCPRCGRAMEKTKHNAAKLVTLDRCEDHGLWCDTKELKQAQVAAQALRMVLGSSGKA